MSTNRCQVHRCLQALVLTVNISAILNENLRHFFAACLYRQMQGRTTVQIILVDELFEVRIALRFWDSRGFSFKVTANF